MTPRLYVMARRAAGCGCYRCVPTSDPPAHCSLSASPACRVRQGCRIASPHLSLLLAHAAMSSLTPPGRVLRARPPAREGATNAAAGGGAGRGKKRKTCTDIEMKRRITEHDKKCYKEKMKRRRLKKLASSANTSHPQSAPAAAVTAVSHVPAPGGHAPVENVVDASKPT
jgi:hypothetical protein